MTTAPHIDSDVHRLGLGFGKHQRMLSRVAVFELELVGIMAFPLLRIAVELNSVMMRSCLS